MAGWLEGPAVVVGFEWRDIAVVEDEVPDVIAELDREV